MFTRRAASRFVASATARRFAAASGAAPKAAAWAGLRGMTAAGAASAAFAFAGATTVMCWGGAKAPYDIAAVSKAIEAKLDDEPAMAPTLVRLAWHEAGTWDAKRKDGCPNSASMRFAPECKHGANAGLDKARAFLESVKAAHPAISYADLWALAGCVAVKSMGGPTVNFRWGRTDSTGATAPDGRLPDASKDQSHVRDVFTRMGFNDRETVALIGAHAVGMCHPQNSGYSGPWTLDPLEFGNGFFTGLVNTKWVVDTTKPQLQYTDDETGTLMMLPADMALMFDKSYRKVVEEYAANEAVFKRDFALAFQKLLELGVADKLN